MSDINNVSGNRRCSFEGIEPHRKKSKVSELLSQVIGTQEVITSQTTNYFAKLPHEVVLCIFKYLDFQSISKCALLCRSFWLASQDGILYQKVCLKYSYHPKHIESYVSKISFPKKLQIIYKHYDKGKPPDDYSHFDNQIIKLLNKCGGCVVSLYVENCRSEEVSLQLSKCSNLRKLHLLRCKGSFRTLPELHNLTNLRFCLCEVPVFIVGELLKSNQRLRILSLTDTTNLQTNTIADIIGNYNPQMEKLYICEKRKVRAKGLRSIAKCPNLRVLELTGGPFHCDPEDSLQQLAAGCTKLEKLAIYGWKSITDENLEPILQTCTQLKVLDLRGLNITVRSCREAALSLPFLKTLDVYKCSRIKKAQLVKLNKEFPEINITN
ncbi:F-box/LRR-repeat protein 4-like [Agrilus planipennis]|uniref:F-box/LRR-repeat protein 4-like n=1 Tax=Agrilus planipennis TaxID=224129 RepID=A0A1W4WP49_AGRPL|nr:F-box/LRR-repeat protein 4-like [Agrilus planipennis]XP_018321879.1 F-box/LRR-repeat protein 4-like [Agrilus planipennis]